MDSSLIDTISQVATDDYLYILLGFLLALDIFLHFAHRMYRRRWRTRRSR